MTNGNRTMAFTISEGLFQRIKAHLDRETARTGKKLTQREFVLGLIEAALNESESQLAQESQTQDEQADESQMQTEQADEPSEDVRPG